MTEALAFAGASVMVVGTDAEVLADVVSQTPGNIIAHQADISDETAVNGLVEATISNFGAIDVVINNAGIGMSNIRSGDRFADPIYFWDVSDEWMQRFYEVHVRGPFLLTKAALPHMRAKGFGRIVTITTSLGTMLRGANAPYGTMKAASEALCSAMSHDLSDSKITANILIPGGAADTRFIPDTPLRPRQTLIRPEVMGAPAVFLASHESDGITGRRVNANYWDPSKSNAENIAASCAPIGWSTE
jgi:NAD(P)-dependent dehydrogenase (short-subunit alcohol dehydrogenase family)